jgi:2,4-dienoyl-CoA reductase-like NADH-dependent reductase (Old Yellow Enzyme family)/thioredoxin reductase
MAGQEFKHLFSPIKIGNLTLRNRIVCPAHCTAFFGEGEAPNERMARYLAARAKGGAAMIVTPQNVVWPSSTSRSYVATCDDRAMPAYEMISRAVHDHGAKVVAQLTHLGSLTGFIDDAGAGFAASVSGGVMGLLPNALGNSVAHEISIDEIKLIVKSYADSARRMKETGYDGVEITCDVGTGGLLVSFLSPLTNRRTDEYGGSLDNRFRMPMEIIDAVRKTVGPDFVVGLRLVGDMLMNGGTTLDDTKVLAAKVEAAGQVDYLSISAGMTGHIPPMYFPLGCFVYLAAGVKEVVSLPVICHGRINDPVQAEQILADSQADLVGLARALICDPEWPNKAREGRTEEIRKCIACIQSCAGNFLRRSPITCAINPEAGREEQMGTIVPAAVKKKVMVIGGGAAGLETARVAALRGHRVTLYEKEKELGGQLNIAARIPKREDFTEVPRYYNYQMKLLGVEVIRETEVTPKMVREKNPDAVVIATGSVRVRPMVKGGDGANVVWVRDVLQEKIEVGEKVVVIAAEQHEQALGVAIFLTDRGKKVELVTHCLYAGSELETNTLTFMYQQLLGSGGIITPVTRVKEISGSTVVVANAVNGAERCIEGVDTVVYSAIGKADDTLYHALKDEVKEIYAVGHCLAPRLLQDSVWDGANAGRWL